jgi:hypothetical protein
MKLCDEALDSELYSNNCLSSYSICLHYDSTQFFLFFKICNFLE